MTNDKELKERTKGWNEAYLSLDKALAHFEQQECEPDPYQHADLVHSLAAFSDGLYGISAIRADDALIPARDRSPISKPLRALGSKFSIAEMRAQLEQIRREGVKPRTIRAGRLIPSGSTKAACPGL